MSRALVLLSQWRCRFYCSRARIMYLRAEIRRPTNSHPYKVLDSLQTGRFEAWPVSGYYYCNLAPGHLSSQLKDGYIYGAGVMFVPSSWHAQCVLGITWKSIKWFEMFACFQLRSIQRVSSTIQDDFQVKRKFSNQINDLQTWFHIMCEPDPALWRHYL